MQRSGHPNATTIRKLGAERLQAIRKKARLTQAEFAERIGVSPKGYSNYERGLRELPQSARLAVLEWFGEDPLSTGDLRVGPSGTTAPRSRQRRGRDRSFWAELRAECRAFRKENFSKPARFMLGARDYAYLSATSYLTIKTLCHSANIPFGVEIGGIDWPLLVSAALICMLFFAVIGDAPVTKVTRHLLGLDQRT